MWNRSLMPTPSSLVWRPSVASEPNGVARARVLAPGCVCSADTISRPWLLVRLRSPLLNEWRSRENCSACSPLRCVGPGGEVRAGEVVVHRRGDVDVDAADLVDHLLEVREVRRGSPTQIGTPTIADTASASARRSLPPGLFTMYELIFAPPGPSVSRGMSMIVADLQRRVHADHVDGVGETGVVGRLAGSSERAPVPSDEREERLLRRAGRARAPPSFVTWNHTAPPRGHGLAERQPGRGDRAGERAARTAAGASDQSGERTAPAAGHFAAPVVAAAVVVVVGRQAGAVAGDDHVVRGDLPGAGRRRAASTKSAVRTMCSGSPLTAVAPVDVEDERRGDQREVARLVAEADAAPPACAVTVEVAGDLRETLVEHDAAVGAWWPTRSVAASNTRAEVGGRRLARPQRLHGRVLHVGGERVEHVLRLRRRRS